MQLSEIISFCNPVKVVGNYRGSADTITQDSRKVSAGDVFIAVRGHQTDGHQYIGQAIKNGARLIICEKLPEHTPTGNHTFIQVEGTRQLLGPLAQHINGNPAKKLKLIGVTGTNGKTTVTTLVYQVLQSLGTPASLLGTVYSYILSEKNPSRLTTSDPVGLAQKMVKMVQAGSTHLVMEVSSHALDQMRVKGLEFDVTAFTNLTHDHLDYHGSFEAYANAKKKLFDNLDESAVAIINSDDERSAYMTQDSVATVKTFGFNTTGSNYPCKIHSQTIFGTKVEVENTIIQSPLVGIFNAYNVAQAYLIVRSLGFSSDVVAHALAHVQGAEGRMERVAVETESPQPLVVVDYAHTPDALENVLATLRGVKKETQSLHLIFGAGGNRDRSKRPEMAAIAEKRADVIYLTSDNPRDESPEDIINEIETGFSGNAAYSKEVDRRRAIEKAILAASSDDIVLITGKGHETYQEIKGVRYDFDDRKIARHALNKKLNIHSNSGEVT